MKIYLRVLSALVLGVPLLACSTSESSSSAGVSQTNASGPSKGGSTGGSGDGFVDVGAGEAPPPGSAGGEQSAQVGAGVLTAGIWDDALNYSFFDKYLATTAAVPGAPAFSSAEYDAAAAEFAPGRRSPHSAVDAAIVLDTTGSMGDELRYLTAEFAGISKAVADKFPGASQRWSLVLYRDAGDEYVVKSFDFTGDPRAFTATLGAQAAGGGGDIPESPEKGLAALPQLGWRSGGDVAKVAFWVGDAPHHQENAGAMKQAIVGAHQQGIHIYPVASSGVDDLLERTMRSAALVTGGRYLFLTDDSGVGNSHQEPKIPCYFVTKLQRSLVRVLASELAGTPEALAPADILRTTGSPTPEGLCATASGDTVQIF